MEESISGNVVRLLPAYGHAGLLLDDAQKIAVCMPAEAFERLHIGDRVQYFAEAGRGPYTKHAGRVVPIAA